MTKSLTEPSFSVARLSRQSNFWFLINCEVPATFSASDELNVVGVALDDCDGWRRARRDFGAKGGKRAVAAIALKRSMHALIRHKKRVLAHTDLA